MTFVIKCRWHNLVNSFREVPVRSISHTILMTICIPLCPTSKRTQAVNVAQHKSQNEFFFQTSLPLLLYDWIISPKSLIKQQGVKFSCVKYCSTNMAKSNQNSSFLQFSSSTNIKKKKLVSFQESSHCKRA